MEAVHQSSFKLVVRDDGQGTHNEAKKDFVSQ